MAALNIVFVFKKHVGTCKIRLHPRNAQSKRVRSTSTHLAHPQFSSAGGFFLNAFVGQSFALHGHLRQRTQSGVSAVVDDDLYATAWLEVGVEAAIPLGMERLLSLLQRNAPVGSCNGFFDVDRTCGIERLGVVENRLEEFDSKERHGLFFLSLRLFHPPATWQQN